MPDYEVVIDTLEGNSDNASVTGRVNGTDVAAVIKTRLLAASVQDVLLERGRYPNAGNLRAKLLAEALVDAFEKRPASPPGHTAVKVTR